MFHQNARAIFILSALLIIGLGAAAIGNGLSGRQIGIPQAYSANTILKTKLTTNYSVSSIVKISKQDLPRIAIIIDDAGENLDLLEQLSKIPFPVTVSVIPGSRHDAESAGWAKRHGFEVMVHLPMEPEAYPEKDPGANAILSSMSKKKLRDVTLDLIEEIPYASGVNNHMGSRLTRSVTKMNPVLNMIARSDLYFVDSRTTPYSVAFKLAQSKKIPSAERNLFLDENMDADAILNRFRELSDIAREQGDAIGIAHLKKETLEALTMIDPAEYRDVQFVFASAVCDVGTRMN